jgi:hypothetical protein
MQLQEGSTLNGYGLLSTGNHLNQNTNPHSDQYPYIKPSFISDSASDNNKYWFNLFNINLAYYNGLSDELYFNFDVLAGGFGAVKGINANVSLVLRCTGTNAENITSEFIVRNKNFRTLTDMFRVYIVNDTINHIFKVSFYAAISHLSGQNVKVYWNKKYSTWHNTAYYNKFVYGNTTLIADSAFMPVGTLYSPYVISECKPQCKVVLTSDTSVTNSTWTQVPFNLSEYEMPIGIKNANTLVVPKTGNYHIQLIVTYEKVTNSTICTTQIYINGSDKINNVFTFGDYNSYQVLYLRRRKLRRWYRPVPPAEITPI